MKKEELPQKFSTFFNDKISDIRKKIDDFEYPIEADQFTGIELSCFEHVSESFVRTLILNAPRKDCELDPLPNVLLLHVLDEIIPIITNIINVSLTKGFVPEVF